MNPLFVVTKITPAEARAPYIACADASFKTSTLLISLAFKSSISVTGEPSTTNNGWFNNLTVSGSFSADTLSLSGASGTLPIANGGTGGITAAIARTNLDVYAKSEVYTQAQVDSQIASGVGGVSTSSITNGTSSVSVANNADITFTHAGITIGAVTASGIDLEDGMEFIGTATSAEFADLAEKYSTVEELTSGTVVCVGSNEDAEVEASSLGSIAIGVVSTDPAFKMNSKAEGQYIALKGRVPVRITGAVNKGQAVYVHDNGCASTAVNGGSIVGIALETNSAEEEKLVECVLKV